MRCSRHSLIAAPALSIVVACNSTATSPRASASATPSSAVATSPAGSNAAAPGSAEPVLPAPSLALPDSPSSVKTVRFTSAALGVEKAYRVYLPRGYEGSAARFPVLYLLHGLGGDETNWLEHGSLQAAADDIGLAAIVVMPDGDAGFYVDSTAPPGAYEACLDAKPPFNPSEPPSAYCVKTPHYERYLVRDLVEEVDQRLRTKPDKAARAIGGLSMGGFGALSLALRNPATFSVAAAHSAPASLRYAGPYPYASGSARLASSTHDWGERYPPKIRSHMRSLFGTIERLEAHDPVALARRSSPKGIALYFDCGTEDGFGFVNHARHLDEVLTQAGIPHQFELAPGGHDFSFWRARLPESLTFVAQHLPPPAPG